MLADKNLFDDYLDELHRQEAWRQSLAAEFDRRQELALAVQDVFWRAMFGDKP